MIDSNGRRTALNHVIDLRAKHGGDEFGSDDVMPTRQAADATRAVPSARIPTDAEKLRQMLTERNDNPNVGEVAKGARQVAANALAGKLRKERRGY